MKIREPSYRSSRRFLWGSFYLAWLVIIGTGIAAALGSEQAVAFGAIAIPSMVGIIIGVLGVHRFSGSMDFRAQADVFRDEHERPRP
ncbi:NAD(P)+ transhydrogenase beta chain [Brucella anthropi]|uniref:NAD(P)+ transhydrogenase beta chain n=1 Tax=Brucella anthropi TaxID=529 RepID=UPI000F66E8F2|nr:NAD(P)+ transhydrogenase beta chain [Brucella anthropi]RRY09025.1 NAD(P)+ transhydrogenase beta chain [Brucella anthropi]